MSSLTLIIDGQSRIVEIPADVMDDGESFFSGLDADMDAGWKVGPEYIENPDQDTRIKIVADRLMAALEAEKAALAGLLAGYIMTRDSSINALRMDMNGEPMNTEILR